MSLGIVLTGNARFDVGNAIDTDAEVSNKPTGEGDSAAESGTQLTTDWSGTWQFAKDRGTSELEFSYKVRTIILSLSLAVFPSNLNLPALTCSSFVTCIACL